MYSKMRTLLGHPHVIMYFFYEKHSVKSTGRFPFLCLALLAQTGSTFNCRNLTHYDGDASDTDDDDSHATKNDYDDLDSMHNNNDDGDSTDNNDNDRDNTKNYNNGIAATGNENQEDNKTGCNNAYNEQKNSLISFSKWRGTEKTGNQGILIVQTRL